MDPFSACLALGPLAIYFVLLGTIHLAGRPLVVRGTRETLALGLALAGLAIVGPLQLFMPQHAAAQFGPLVWGLLIGFYALCLLLLLIVSRPRLVIYNAELDSLRGPLDETIRRLDAEATWSGDVVNMPLVRVQLQVVSFAPLSTVSLVSVGDRQSIGGWRRLESALRTRLRELPARHPSRGTWLLAWGLLILAALGIWIADDPQTIARGLGRLLQP